jgi:tetratricopeptide (TPR) repeat protein
MALYGHAMTALEGACEPGQEPEALSYLYNDIGASYFQSGRFKEALEPLTKAALSLHAPEDTYIALENVGTAYHKLGDLTSAVRWWRRAAAMMEGTMDGVVITDLRVLRQKIEDARSEEVADGGGGGGDSGGTDGFTEDRGA